MSDSACRSCVAAVLLLLAGCALGPDYARPSAPSADRFTAEAPKVIHSGPSLPEQAVRRDATVPARWWTLFGSPALDAVVERTLAGSPTLASARAALARAEHDLAATRGATRPQVGVSAAAQRGKPDTSGAVSNGFMAEPTAIWNTDIFGGGRRRVEQSGALVDYARAQRQAARLALVAGAVQQVIAIASIEEQIAATQDILAADEENLMLVEVSAEAGKSARLDVLTARSQLESDRALLPVLRQQASAGRHALALLAGEEPASWSPPPIALRSLSLPPELPLAVPSEWLRRRPDIEAAQAQLHAANAAIGIAASSLYPSVTLSAGWTLSGHTPAALFGAAATPWTLAAQLLGPVFDGGTLAARRAAAVDAYAVQLAAYRQAVLQAFSEVADAMEQTRNDAQLLEIQTRALETAAATLDMTREGYRAGQASLVQLLDAQRLYQQARLGRARALGQRFADCVRWFVAMGAGEDGSSVD